MTKTYFLTSVFNDFFNYLYTLADSLQHIFAFLLSLVFLTSCVCIAFLTVIGIIGLIFFRDKLFDVIVKITRWLLIPSAILAIILMDII